MATEWGELVDRRRFGKRDGRKYAERRYYVNTLNVGLAYTFGPDPGDPYPGHNDTTVVRKEVTLEGANAEVVVTYREQREDEPQPGNDQLNFNTAAQQEKRKVLPSTLNASHTTAGDMEVVGHEGQGVQVYLPTFRYGEAHWYETIARSYLQSLYELTGKVNKYAWKGFAAGAVLFLGAQGRYDNFWRVDYSFLVREPYTDVEIYSGGSLETTVAEVDGWDKIWREDKEHYDSTTEDVVRKIHNTYIVRPYERRNFANIGIGT